MKKMTSRSKIILLAVFALIFTGAIALQAEANTLQYDLDYVITGSSPSGTSPWITVTFTDVSANSVQLTMTASNLTGYEFIRGLYFNFDPVLNSDLLSFTPDPTNPVGTTAITNTNGCCKADGDGFFDFMFDFPTANTPLDNRFQAGESVVYNISYAGGTIDVSSFQFLSSVGGGTGTYLAAAQVQGITGMNDTTTSSWVGATTVVPEPISSILFVTGGTLLAGRSFLRKKKKA